MLYNSSKGQVVIVNRAKQPDPRPLDLHKHAYYTFTEMKIEISSTEAARNLGECLARIKHTGDRFVLMKNRRPVAELGPVSGMHRSTLRMLWKAMRETKVDEDFARDLERVNASDVPFENPWQ